MQEVNSNCSRYCSLVISREVFFVSEGHRNPRHMARIYAISINSVHREAVTENGVNSNLFTSCINEYTKIVLTPLPFSVYDYTNIRE